MSNKVTRLVKGKVRIRPGLVSRSLAATFNSFLPKWFCTEPHIKWQDGKDTVQGETAW